MYLKRKKFNEDMRPTVLSPNTSDHHLRASTLERYGLANGICDQFCENVVLLASMVCAAPFAAISLVSEGRHFFKAAVGLSVDKVTQKGLSFCEHAILQPGMMLVPNAMTDERFRHNPFVTGEANIRFYAGFPLVTAAGERFGTVCVLDVVARGLLQEQRAGLRMLAENMVLHLSASS